MRLISPREWVISSAVERFVHIEDVSGSNPLSPTIQFKARPQRRAFSLEADVRQDFPEIYVLRHGETVWNREGRMQGALDSPLTDLGREQAETQGRLLAEAGALGLTVYASPQRRVFETARIALSGRGVTPRVDARLREISLGAWEGLTRAEIAARWPGTLDVVDPVRVYDNAPGGEGVASVAARVAEFLAELEGPSVIFSHGVTSRILRCVALRWPLSEFRAVPAEQGVVYHLRDGIQNVIEP